MLGAMLGLIYDQIYPIDGVKTEVNNYLFLNNPPSRLLDKVSSFIGWPNRIFNPNEGQSIKNLFMNFIGYQDNVSIIKKIINFFITPFIVLLNIINIPCILFRNLLKLVTEFLPLTLATFLHKGRIWLQTTTVDNPVFRIFTPFLKKLMALIHSITSLVFFAGRAITSPIQNIRDAWRSRDIESPNGTLLAACKIVISAAITITTYTFMLPIAMKLVATWAAQKGAMALSYLSDLLSSKLFTVGLCSTTMLLAPTAEEGVSEFRNRWRRPLPASTVLPESQESATHSALGFSNNAVLHKNLGISDKSKVLSAPEFIQSLENTSVNKPPTKVAPKKNVVTTQAPSFKPKR